MLDGFLKTRDTEDCSNAVMAAEYSALPGQENFTFYNILKGNSYFTILQLLYFQQMNANLVSVKCFFQKQ